MDTIDNFYADGWREVSGLALVVCGIESDIVTDCLTDEMLERIAADNEGLVKAKPLYRKKNCFVTCQLVGDEMVPVAFARSIVDGLVDESCRKYLEVEA